MAFITAATSVTARSKSHTASENQKSIADLVLTVAELSGPRVRLVRCSRSGLRRHRRPAAHLLLKTRTAENWSALCWFEGNSRLSPALRAGCTGLRPHAPTARALRLALLAVFRVVLELLIVEEKLLARGEYKFRATVAAFQNPVDEFHGRFPKEGQNEARPST